MTAEELLPRLEALFSDVLARKVRLAVESTPDTVDGWDSFAQISILSAIEDEFGIRFAMREIPDLNSVSAILARLENLTNQQ